MSHNPTTGRIPSDRPSVEEQRRRMEAIKKLPEKLQDGSNRWCEKHDMPWTKGTDKTAKYYCAKCGPWRP